MTADYTCIPVVVHPGIDVDGTYRAWKHSQAKQDMLQTVYIVRPLNNDGLDSLDNVNWLDVFGLSVPDAYEQGRWRTIAETIDVLESVAPHCRVDGFRYGPTGTLYLGVVAVETTSDEVAAVGQAEAIITEHLQYLDAQQQRAPRWNLLCGTPSLALLVAKRIVALCGPHVVWGEHVPVPVVVDADTDLDVVATDWEAARTRYIEEADRAGEGAEGP
jgi:hypothetical protein